ncbi:MAG: hypothetical protein APF76_04125 [Desulfitibacter sp. BRH_c19]|nr:MAG: hypothetical protein APF76_04125 [Desulfitibacter sp. BRH_c19]
MNEIRILDVATSNKIAAGEVIERPASVVKELIENSIDAGARNISIKIYQGGISKIIVSDDGSGIAAEQITLAFKRHATSKISSAAELFSIQTHGFRGEALPSIASVAKVTLITKNINAQVGIKYVIEGGKDILKEEVSSNNGTYILVKDLFYNVPPRRKHLKSVTKEAGNTAQVVTSMALGNPNISFKYTHNDKLIFQSAGKGNLENNILNILGLDLIKNLIPVTFERNEDQRIDGYISKPQYNRASKHNQYLYVNNRWVYSPTISKVISKAYNTLIPNDRHPIYILNLKTPYSGVDVNVHPTKREIRFDNDQLIEELILDAIKEALKSQDSIFIEKPKREKTFFKEENKQVEFTWKASTQPQSEFKSKELPITKNEFIEEIENEKIDKRQIAYTENVREDNKCSYDDFFPTLKPLEQIDGSYIIAINELQKGFYLIDQHAAHERIFYDRLKNKTYTDENRSQLLLNPEVIDLTPAEKDFLIENMIMLQNAGFTFEHFGENSFLLRGVPVDVDPGNGSVLIKEMLDKLIGQSEKPSQDRLVKMIACKAVITAKKILTKNEMQELLNMLSKTEVPYTCPHGRPTTIHITAEELIKRFHR